MPAILEIEPGEIRIGGGAITLLDEPHVRVWHVDLDSKYAQVLTYSADEVLLIADERTLRTDTSRRGKPTVLKVNLPDDWQIIVDCSRYTCRIVGYKPTSP
jgi:hypothetical protein